MNRITFKFFDGVMEDFDRAQFEALAMACVLSTHGDHHLGASSILGLSGWAVTAGEPVRSGRADFAKVMGSKPVTHLVLYEAATERPLLLVELTAKMTPNGGDVIVHCNDSLNAASLFLRADQTVPQPTIEHQALALLNNARELLRLAGTNAGSRELSVAMTECDTSILWLREHMRFKHP